MRAGFIGLGSQGAPMARRIVDAGMPLTIWARRPETLEPFADTAAVGRATPAELAANSDVVGICVVSDADVEDVVLRDDGVLAGMAAGGDHRDPLDRPSRHVPADRRTRRRAGSRRRRRAGERRRRPPLPRASSS